MFKRFCKLVEESKNLTSRNGLDPARIVISLVVELQEKYFLIY